MSKTSGDMMGKWGMRRVHRNRINVIQVEKKRDMEGEMWM